MTDRPLASDRLPRAVRADPLAGPGWALIVLGVSLLALLFFFGGTVRAAETDPAPSPAALPDDAAEGTRFAITVRPDGARVVVDRRMATGGARRIAIPVPPAAEVEAVAARVAGRWRALPWSEHVDLGHGVDEPVVVSAILPGDGGVAPVETRIVYRLEPARDAGVYRLTVPLSLPEGFAFGDTRVAALGALPAGLAAAAEARGEQARAEPVRINVDLLAGRPLARVSSPSHGFDHVPGGRERVGIMIGGDAVPVDRDFVLIWELAGAPAE